MKMSNVLMRVLAAFIALSVIEVIAGALATFLMPGKAVEPTLAPHFFQWMLLTNLVTAGALSAVALRTEWRGWNLGLAVAAIPTAIAFINGIEGSIFLKNSHIDWPRIFVMTAIASVLSVPVWMLLFGRRPASLEPHSHPIASKSRAERAWKFLVCDFAYIAVYITAGIIILPYIKDFYATQTVPSPSAIFALQLLVRGPAFVLLCLLLVRMLGMPRLRGALAVGAIFTLLSSVAPLLMPNPYFPDAVRWAHFCEVTSSNFVFGMIVAWLWGQPKLVHSTVLAHAA